MKISVLATTNRRPRAARLLRFVPLVLLIPVVARAQTTSASDRLEALITARFESTKCPGLSVAVASQNKLIFSKAVGMADIEQGVPLRTDSVHRLGSLSKPITGAIIIDLVEQRKLALDVSIRQYLPELPDSFQEVTIRHLLSHESGVQFLGDEIEVAFSTKHYATSREALKLISPSPSFEAGTKVQYSSAAFTVLGAAAEAATGRSFQQLAADFFARHGIGGFALDDPYAVIRNRVRGYLVDRNSKIELSSGRTRNRDYLIGSSGEITNAVLYDISNRYPAGGFDASPEDLLRFVIAVSVGKVLKPQTVSEMWTAQSTSDGKKSVFGLGWGVSQRNGQPMVGMNGAEPSTMAFLRYFPSSGVGVTLVCNAEGAQDLAKLLDEILETTLPQSHAPGTGVLGRMSATRTARFLSDAS